VLANMPENVRVVVAGVGRQQSVFGVEHVA
jgi:hypothetical protein